MLRRNPTRIELKLDDMSEYTDMRDEMKNHKDMKTGTPNVSSSSMMATKTRQEVHDRLGYVPHPRPSA